MSYNKKTKMYEGYIYCLTNKVNGKKYIGQTNRSINERYNEHIRKSRYNRDNQYLYTAMKKYGKDNFIITEVEKVTEINKNLLSQKLNQREIFYIDSLKTRKPCGYNMTDGGVLLPNTYVRKPVCNYDLERNLVNEFESITDAACYYNISQADITHCCNREKLNMVGGYIWRFKGDDCDVKSVEIPAKVIIQYDFEGNFINKYYGIKEATIKTGIRNISNCCNGRYKSAGGYIWRFLGDKFDKYNLPKTINKTA